MILNIPFELGQEVWVWENHPHHTTREVPDGYDHLGPKSTIVTEWQDNYKACKYNFYFGLLDDFNLSEIYKSKYECEKAAQSIF